MYDLHARAYLSTCEFQPCTLYLFTLYLYAHNRSIQNISDRTLTPLNDKRSNFHLIFIYLYITHPEN